MDSYTAFAKVYDLLMDNVPYEDWARIITEILGANGIGDGLVLDLACGTGTMTGLLAEAGYDMIAADASAEMLEAAREKAAAKGTDILFLCQDMRSFELYGTVRAVVCMCDSINYLLSKEDLLACFKLVNNYLDPGGLFLFDFHPAEYYSDCLGDTVIAERREECSFIWENSLNGGINECLLTMFVRGEDGRYDCFEEQHLQRGYTLPEIKSILAEAGLVFEESREIGDEGDERILVVAREQGK
ncbi:MAG: class I SAM-dependent methyltransferase [Clostridia bacterium]|nr:class I SAM-dependent methyltransferase [Clostridia bacterium]